MLLAELSLNRWPLSIATLIACCGISLIIFSDLWPTGPPTGKAQERARRTDAQRRRGALLEELRRQGLTGNVDVADFGDGFGLAVTRAVGAGDEVMRVPGSMALSADRTPSCGLALRLDCRIERNITKAVARKELTWKAGLLAMVVLELQRGYGHHNNIHLERSVVSDMLEVLLERREHETSNIFTVTAEESRLFSAGTSMETWHERAVAETELVHGFVQKSLPGLRGVSLEQVQLAYMFLHSFGQWPSSSAAALGADDGLELPREVLFLSPLFMARPTPTFEQGVQLIYHEPSNEYQVLTPVALRPGQELHFVDWRLTDASAFSFRGLWLTSRHRTRLTLDVSSMPRDPNSQPLLAEYGCAAQPLTLYVQSSVGLDKKLLGCMRLIALGRSAAKLQAALQKGYGHAWPHTAPISHRDEVMAVEILTTALMQVLHRLDDTFSNEIRQHSGSEVVAEHPLLKVREAEMMIVLGLLRSAKELQLVVSDEHIYEAFVRQWRVAELE